MSPTELPRGFEEVYSEPKEGIKKLQQHLDSAREMLNGVQREAELTLEELAESRLFRTALLGYIEADKVSIKIDTDPDDLAKDKEYLARDEEFLLHTEDTIRGFERHINFLNGLKTELGTLIVGFEKIQEELKHWDDISTHLALNNPNTEIN